MLFQNIQQRGKKTRGNLNTQSGIEKIIEIRIYSIGKLTETMHTSKS